MAWTDQQDLVAQARGQQWPLLKGLGQVKMGDGHGCGNAEYGTPGALGPPLWRNNLGRRKVDRGGFEISVADAHPYASKANLT